MNNRSLIRTFILYFLLSATVAQAQGGFAPGNAQWHHEMGFGSFHCVVTGDTVIQGVSARKISQSALVKDPWFSQGFQVFALPDIYLHDAVDTVFAYNELFNKFTPLYVFNAQDGDTLCLPILPVHGNGFPSGTLQDSTFCVVVDSVRMVLYDTSLLKTFFTRSLGVSGSDYRLNWGSDTVNGAYAEKVGSVNSGLFPHCVGLCIWLLTENAQRPGVLRCYQDSNYNIKLVTNDCDNEGFSASVTGIEQTKINIYPNPADGRVYIQSGNKPVVQIQATDITGRVLLQLSGNPASLSTDQLADGMYFLKLVFKDRTIHTEKIIIRH